ncbi:hypothetical protein B7463_g4903, partial [Scytalidium lignicola]
MASLEEIFATLPDDYVVNSQAFTRVTHRNVYSSIDPSKSSLSQSGKVVIITGASKGIGYKGFVAAFAKAGADGLVLVARNKAALQEVETETKILYPGIQVVSVAADVSNEKSVTLVFDAVKKTFGNADVLVNNAGTTSSGSIKDVDMNTFWKDFEINVKGTLLMTQGFLRLIDSSKPAHIITVSSAMGLAVLPSHASYSLSKLVQQQLSRFIATENPNVTAISIHPGTVHTDLVNESKWLIPQAKDTPELVGGFALWLTTEEAKFLNQRYVSANWDVDELVRRKEEIDNTASFEAFCYSGITREVIRRSEVVKEKQKPVRRDPERRRQQNIQAQRKYREKLRERLDRLEALAASVAESTATERTPAAGTSPSETATMLSLSRSLPRSNTSDISNSSSSVATLSGCQHLIPWPNDPPSTLGAWDSTTHFDPSLLIRDKLNSCIDPHCTTTIDCGCSKPHLQIQTQGPDPFSSGKVRILSLGPNTTTPDPYANNLRIETVCITAALYNLGMYVGVTEEMLCADQSLSPFFRSSASAANDMAKANTISTVQKIFKTLKPDLRPSSEQITTRHHPYIDILPFPTLRKNLITHQDKIDEDEFFNDVLTGLVCWGGAGIGKRDRGNSTGYASTGTPWDVRSWEAKEWFLKKYWALLGGGDGELVRQSEWWRSIRGEDTVDMGLCS